MNTSGVKRTFWAVLACGALLSPMHTALAQGADAAAQSWDAVAEDSLGDLRGGLRVGGLDVSLQVLVRDVVDGREVLRRSFAVGSADAASARDALVLPPLVNTRDGASIQRETTARVRVQGYRKAFGAASTRSVRARIQRSLR